MIVALRVQQVLARMGEYIVICTLLSLLVAQTMLAPLLCVASEARARRRARREDPPTGKGVVPTDSGSKAESAPVSGTAGTPETGGGGRGESQPPESGAPSESTRTRTRVEPPPKPAARADEEEGKPWFSDLLQYV